MTNIFPPYRGQGEVHFLKLMAEEIENGGYAPGLTFRSESMLCVFRKFRIVCCPIYSDCFLKIKIKQIKKKYQEFSELMSQDAIYWNKKNNVVYGNMKLLSEKYNVKKKKIVSIVNEFPLIY
ncbi:hypothetical protein PHJA_002318900 [Phtheirospermum japonicum]|uniref:Myb/SANT-like domain-containing protein n=1 Tax=Phtheirospermum japonicum TaxID=374723 RepID=A0A830CRZ3_9LAMI|nr:hypothetical protein PHJA_002318900 [Phtheirospermum japonicum]